MSEIHRNFFPQDRSVRGRTVSSMGSVFLRVTIGLVLALSAPGAAAASTAPATGSGGACGNALVFLHTLHIEAKPSKKVYQRGETIVAHMWVTRPAEHDPGGNGIPMDRPMVEPAPDVDVGTAMWVGNTYRWAFGVTDEEGHAILKVKMPKDSDTGNVRAAFQAEKIHYSNNGCPDIREVGWREYPNFTKVEG